MVEHSLANIFDFLARNEGQIVGATLSGLIALFAFYLGIKVQKRKDKKVYTGNLFSLLTELEWKKGTIDRAVKELNTIKTQSIEEGRIITPHATSNLNTENLLQIRDNLVTFEKANSQILLLTNIIINLSLEINSSLDFSRPIQYLEERDDIENANEAIEGYFDNLIDDHFGKLFLAIENLQKAVKKEINNYPEAEALTQYNI